VSRRWHRSDCASRPLVAGCVDTKVARGVTWRRVGLNGHAAVPPGGLAPLDVRGHPKLSRKWRGRSSWSRRWSWNGRGRRVCGASRVAAAAATRRQGEGHQEENPTRRLIARRPPQAVTSTSSPDPSRPRTPLGRSASATGRTPPSPARSPAAVHNSVGSSPKSVECLSG
jgi:hypothetical protein